MDESTRRRLRYASQEELERARQRGELSEDDYDEIIEARRRSWVLYVTVLSVVALFGLGVLIVCGGCGLMLLHPH